MRKIVISTLSLVMVSSSLVQAEVKISKTAEGGYSVSACESDMPRRGQVTFQIGSNGLEQIENIKDQCAVKTYSKGIVKPGQEVVVKYTNTNSIDKTLRKSIPEDQSSRDLDSSTQTRIENIDFTVVEKSSTEIEITGCNKKFKLYDAVTVTNRNSLGSAATVSKASTITKDSNGKLCFSVSFKKGEIQDGDEIGIGLYSVDKPVVVTMTGIPWKRSSSHTGAGSDVGGSSSGPTTSPGPNPAPAPQTSTAPVDNRRVEGDTKVRNKAKSAAESFAAQVVNNLGEIENIRYNLFLGFRNAETVARTFGSRLENMPEYRIGYNSGESDGDSAGYRAGQSEAARTAQYHAQMDVGQAVDLAMNNGGHFEPKMQNHSANGFTGLASPLEEPKDIESRLRDKDSEITQALRRETQFDSDVQLADDLINGYYRGSEIFSIHDYRSDYVLSSYRAERAFSAWLDNALNGKTTLQNYFREVTNSDLYKDASENRRVFTETFLDEYDRVITSRWNNAVTRARPSVEMLGEQFYVSLSKEYAKDLGYFDGYKRKYSSASVLGFTRDLQADYRSSFESVVTQVRTSALIMGTTFAPFMANGAATVTLGDAINLLLVSVANRGMVAGVVSGTVQGTELVGVMKPNLSVSVAPLSKMASLNLGAVAYVARLSQPDENLSFQVVTNQGVFNLKVRSDFETLLRRLVSSKDAQLKAVISGYLVKFLSAEFSDKKKTLGNGFDDHQGTLLLERLVASFKKMTAVEQKTLQSYGPMIKQAYGDKPGWFSPYGDDFKSAMELLAQMGI